ncbi:MAG: NADH-quinone oxidoreductase subunit L [Myxococcota bacterium]
MHEEPTQQLSLLLIILFPLAGAAINGLFGRRMPKGLVSFLGVGAVAVSFVLAILSFISLFGMRSDGVHEAALTYQFYEWFSLKLPSGAEVPINVRFLMDSLSGVMTLVVTGIGGLIHLYSVGYMSEDDGYARFFAYLNLFTASMLILVLGSSLPVMFVGWEGVGLCSYLLIGFWYENREYAAAGRKAFVANRVGDFGVLIGMFILVGVAGSFEFADINDVALSGGFEDGFPSWPFAAVPSLATVACLFLFLGCTGKSAQIPLYVWLPDAMAGPTPVSALIHAATMVTAGVYLCCRLSPLFITSDVAMAVIAVTGTLTALLAATIAVTQHEMKKILAYSTVSQLGFMFAAVGVGFFAAGFFHVFTHAFFKACLFLGAGSVMHSVHAHGDADIYKLGGLKKYMPITRITFLFSCLAIAGFPFSSGFFSKDEILLGAAAQAFRDDDPLMVGVGWFTLIGLTLGAIMTGFYMFRLYFLTFTGEYRSAEGSGDGHGYDAHPHESPPSMSIPLIVLGVGALIVGFLGIPHIAPGFGWHLDDYSWWGHWMEASVAGHELPEDLFVINLASGLALMAMLIGIGAAWVLYRNKSTDPIAEKAPKRVYQFIFDKWRVDEFYQAVIINPIKSVATVIGRSDLTFVDALLTRLPSLNARGLGQILARFQNGVVQTYGMVVVVGVAAVMAMFWMPRAQVEGQLERGNLQLVASPGLGYEYRWDANSDGNFDGAWSTERVYSPTYDAGDVRETVLYVRSPRTGASHHFELTEEWEVLPLDSLDPRWRRAKNTLPVAARLHEGGVQLRLNGAKKFGASDSPELLDLTMGRGTAVENLLVVPRQKIVATVEVRNAFGNVATASRNMILPDGYLPQPHAALVGEKEAQP